jgi:hypothetical protein
VGEPRPPREPISVAALVAYALAQPEAEPAGSVEPEVAFAALAERLTQRDAWPVPEAPVA